MSKRNTWVHGLVVGAIAAGLDVALIAAVEPSASKFVLAQAGLFWLTAGLVVVGSDLGLGWLAHGLVTTVLLCLPWYVLESFASGHPEHLPPLVVQSLLFGTGFAWARRRIAAASDGAVTRGA